MSNSQTLKRYTRVAEGIYRYHTGGFYLRRKVEGCSTWVKLKSIDLQAARREARDIITAGGKVSRSEAKRTVREFVEAAFDRLTADVAPGTKKNREAHRKLILNNWPGPKGADAPISTANASAIQACLTAACAGKSASYANSVRHLFFVAFKIAVENHAIARVPDSDKDQKISVWAWRKVQPHRGEIPSVDDWRAIVSAIRDQPFSDTAKESADVVEAMGLLGLGQAELAAMQWKDVDLQNASITCRRIKTGKEFFVPMQPAAVELMERRFLVTGQKPTNNVFTIREPKKAIATACERLNFPDYTSRGFRKMYVTQALRAGVNPKIIADIQGHQDGGKLILQTYSDIINSAERQAAAATIAKAFTAAVPA